MVGYIFVCGVFIQGKKRLKSKIDILYEHNEFKCIYFRILVWKNSLKLL